MFLHDDESLIQMKRPFYTLYDEQVELNGRDDTHFPYASRESSDTANKLVLTNNFLFTIREIWYFQFLNEHV